MKTGLRKPRLVALCAIGIPIIIVTPLNIAVLLLARGLILQATALEIFTKLLGTIVIARFFKLTKRQLLSFRPIAWIYNTVTAWLRWAHRKVTETAVYQWSKQLKAGIKTKALHGLNKFHKELKRVDALRPSTVRSAHSPGQAYPPQAPLAETTL